MEMFEPKIIGFLCNWCCYAGADLAGVSRFQYPPNIRIIRMMCSGRIDPVIILDTFLYGADAVFIGGCHLGDCHYISGNYYAEKKIDMTKMMLKEVGVEPQRLRLEWVSASEGARFASLVTEFTEEMRELGPIEVEKEEMEAMLFAAADYRLRILATKQKELMEEGNKYGEVFTKHEMDRLLEDMIKEEYQAKRILLMLKNPLSVKEIASKMNLPSFVVLRHVLDLKRYELVDIHKIEDNTPVYIAKVVSE
jgi:coenzyme F420-reducing hydrogenase delta subunit